MPWEGEGLPKLSVCQSEKPEKPLAENTHGYMRATSQHAHTHTHTLTHQLSERLGIALLISFSVDTLFLRCAMLSQLPLSLPHHVGILKLEVYSFPSVSAEGRVHTRGPEVCVFTESP